MTALSEYSSQLSFLGRALVLAILYWICFAYILIYAISPKRSPGERWFSFGVLGVSFALDYFLGFGWILIMLWGGLCWAGARAGET